MRIAIISDIHEDIISLEKALQKIQKLDCDQVICLGDISGYGLYHAPYFDRRNAHACLQLIQNACDTIILGNHDLQAIQKVPHNLEGFNYPENWYALDYHRQKELSENLLWLYEDELDALYTKEDKTFLIKKNEFEIIQNTTRSILFSHYAYPNLTGSLREFNFEKEDYDAHFKFMEKYRCFYSFVGHEHANGLVIVNKSRLIEKKFTNYTLPDTPAIIVAPAIVRSNKRSGFLVFDTENFVIEAIKI